jgi:hypothetical protein
LRATRVDFDFDPLEVGHIGKVTDAFYHVVEAHSGGLSCPSDMLQKQSKQTKSGDRDPGLL